MSWPLMIQEPASRLRVRAKAVVVVLDDVTGRPSSQPPAMRLQQLLDKPTGAGKEAVDLDRRTRLTLGGAVVFDAHLNVNDTPTLEHYKLIVDGDEVQRPDRPNGYAFTVGKNPTRWPVRLVVRLLPGPAYRYQLRVPVVHGSVVELLPPQPPAADTVPPPVADAVVVASEDAGVTSVARCATDERGSFSLGLPSYRPSKSFLIRATARGFKPSPWRRLTPLGLQRPFQLTVRR
jgi:hypothetical protein